MTPSIGSLRLFGPEMLLDPYPAYHALRSADPVCWYEPFGVWLLTRYDDVVAALHDPRIANDRIGQMWAIPDRDNLDPLFPLIGSQMNFADPPRHTRLRTLVSKAFTPHAIEARRPYIQELIDGLLEPVQHKGAMDVIRDFAFPLPATVIVTMLGLPAADVSRLKEYSDHFNIVFSQDASAISPAQYQLATETARSLFAYFRAAIARLHGGEAGDLLSALKAPDANGEQLTETELIANANLLLLAGHETTTHLIGNGLLALLRNPDQLRLLQADPTLLPRAIEEFLRFDGTVQFMHRVAREDLEIRGKTIRKGQVLYLVFAAANRDPAQFPDPDRLDITRSPNHHVAFSMGPHFCLGALLARLEARLAFETLLRRFPKMRLGDGPLVWQENFHLRGLQSLPVSF